MRRWHLSQAGLHWMLNEIWITADVDTDALTTNKW